MKNINATHRSFRPSLRPPFRALIAFEAAARIGSFGAAARELHLTPSAVSHQIIGLERLLGVELFARVGRGIQLTTHGESYFEHVTHLLSALDEATWDLINAGASEVISIHTPPSIASGWLLPLLTVFMRTHPHIQVRVSAEPRRTRFSWNEIDLAIQYREPSAHGENELPLLKELVQPMCSPQILHERAIRLPEDVLQHVLIHSRYNIVSWKDWFNAHHVSNYSSHTRVQIDPSHVAIEAATKSIGIVLESDILAKEELASGRLIVPLPDCAIYRNSYVLAWSQNKKLTPNVKLFRDWLVDMAERYM